eukprot:4804546-Amphidinium_carterae.1
MIEYQQQQQHWGRQKHQHTYFRICVAQRQTRPVNCMDKTGMSVKNSLTAPTKGHLPINTPHYVTYHCCQINASTLS